MCLFWHKMELQILQGKVFIQMPMFHLNIKNIFLLCVSSFSFLEWKVDNKIKQTAFLPGI